MITKWLTAIGTIGASVVALFLAIFHERLRTLLWHPTLDIALENQPPDCQLMTVTNTITVIGATNAGAGGVQAGCYYFRLRVYNNGRSSAEMVEVFVEEVHRRRADGTFERWQGFLSLNLVWAHYNSPYFPRIPPHVYKHCDLGHILDPSLRQQFPGEDIPTLGIPKHQTVMCLGLIVRPSTGSYLIPPGFYRLVIVAVAANAGIARRTVELNLTGQWYADEERMLREGVGLTLL